MSSPEDRRLFGQLAFQEHWGPIEGVLATSYEFDAAFLEQQLIPSLFELPGHGTGGLPSKSLLEQRLGQLEGFVVMIDAHGCRTRPGSLRIEFKAAQGPGKLHAKLLLIVHPHAVRLITGSHNLTENGWRLNLEVSTSLIEDGKSRQSHSELIRSALQQAPDLLPLWWNEDAERIRQRALRVLDQIGPARPSRDDRFAWSGPNRPLLPQLLELWPEGEKLREITLVSPFWSGDARRQPVTELIEELRRRALLGDDFRIRLITDLEPVNGVPLLPEGLLRACSGAKGCRIEAAPFLPDVPPEENAQAAEVGRRRPFHAKCALFEGDRTTVAYAGSANFTRRGWGIGGNPGSNIEAGLLMRRSGAERAALQALLPPVKGNWHDLVQPRKAFAGQPDENVVAETIWPQFVADLRLCTASEAVDRARLRILLSQAPDHEFSVWLVAGDSRERLLLVPEGAVATEHWVDLNDRQLEAAIYQRALSISWQTHEREVPLNVDTRVREQLPLGPLNRQPGESELIRFFQGQISFEALFGEEGEELGEGNAAGSEIHTRSEVETGRIQSYQIREFVAALEGIRASLREASGHERAMRMALLGPASPVALSALIIREVEAGRRTPLAAAFQLGELLLAISELGGSADANRWEAHRREAAGRIAERLRLLKSRDASLGTGAFARYEKMLSRLRDERERAR